MPSNAFAIRDNASYTLEGFMRLITTYKVSSNTSSMIFHPDELTECGRKIIYRKRNHKCHFCNNAEYSYDKFAKCRWISLLKQCSDIKVLDSDILANDMKYDVVTKIDCVIEIPSMDDLQTVVYIRSIPSSIFENVKKNGALRKDIVRIMTDMWLIELINGMIIYEDRDSLDFIIYSVLPQNAVINSIKARAKQLYEHLINTTIPLRPYKNHDTKECGECEFFKMCWE